MGQRDTSYVLEPAPFAPAPPFTQHFPAEPPWRWRIRDAHGALVGARGATRALYALGRDKDRERAK
jgi:hypothetical protein